MSFLIPLPEGSVERLVDLRFGWRDPCFSKDRDAQISQVELDVRRLLVLSGHIVYTYPGTSFTHSSSLLPVKELANAVEGHVYYGCKN